MGAGHGVDLRAWLSFFTHGGRGRGYAFITAGANNFTSGVEETYVAPLVSSCSSCSRCSAGTYGPPDCVDCGQCFANWNDSMTAVSQQIREVGAYGALPFSAKSTLSCVPTK